MNPQEPVGPEFKESSLNKKFSYSFTRKQLIVLFNVLAPIQLPIGDMRTATILEVLDEIKRTAIASITENDYKDKATENHVNSVQTN